jgi:hypothetical protein
MVPAEGDPHELTGVHRHELGRADAAMAEMVDDYKETGPPVVRRGEDDELPSSALHLLLFSPFVTVEAREPRPRQSV